MSILSDFFIDRGSATPDYRGGAGVAAEDKVQLRRVTPLEAAGMLAVLRRQDEPKSLLKEFPLLTPKEADDWTMAVPRDMVDALAALRADEYPTVASGFAKITAAERGWQARDFEPVVADLATLARRAVDTHARMFLWNSI